MKSKSMTASPELFAQLPKPWEPHAYQKQAIKFLLQNAAGALFLDPGLGKTSITLAAIKILKKKNMCDKVLIIAPLRPAHSVWPAEVKKWSDFRHLKVVVLHGPKKQELLDSDADIYVINPEGLDWLLDAQKKKNAKGKISVSVDVRRFKQFGFDTLVIDELSKFKHTQAVRFKAMKHVLGTFSRRWGLTGSPAANGLMNLFGQIYMIDQGRSFGQYITGFRNEYFTPGYDGFTWNLQDDGEDRIYKRIKPVVLRMSAEDYLELPQLVEDNIYIDLPKKAQALYDSLENDLIAMIEDRVLMASNAATASIKCRQVASGGIYYDPTVEALQRPKKGEREWIFLHDEKTDALSDLVDELQGSPLLVAYDFQHDLDRIREKLGDLPYIGGGVSSKLATSLEKQWNRGELPVLLGHPQSIGHGLNLQEAGHHVAWYSLTWDYELYDQLIRRVLRQGNKSKRVFVHHLLARGTIDELMLTILKSKRGGQQALFDALKKLQRTRSRPR